MMSSPELWGHGGHRAVLEPKSSVVIDPQRTRSETLTSRSCDTFHRCEVWPQSKIEIKLSFETRFPA
jgi:hypothetical protein